MSRDNLNCWSGRVSCSCIEQWYCSLTISRWHYHLICALSGDSGYLAYRAKTESGFNDIKLISIYQLDAVVYASSLLFFILGMTMTKAAMKGIPMIDAPIQRSGDWAGGSSEGDGSWGGVASPAMTNMPDWP